MLGGRSVWASAKPNVQNSLDGKFTNAARTSTYSSNKARQSLAPRVSTRPANNARAKMPMTRAKQRNPRGGFGKWSQASVRALRLGRQRKRVRHD